MPVLLQAATWDPDSLTLDRWLESQLAELYPDLSSGRFGSGCTGYLLTHTQSSWHLLPIIDGIDEMDPDGRSLALKALGSSDRPMVVTCRAQEYEEAVLISDRALSSDASVGNQWHRARSLTSGHDRGLEALPHMGITRYSCERTIVTAGNLRPSVRPKRSPAYPGSAPRPLIGRVGA
jgi:DNA-directed RNA polymerase subunit N (RpoN/RPB10)